MTDKTDNNDEILHCSFCGKSQSEVKKLVAGRGVYICDECIEVCKICRRRQRLRNFLTNM